jgi:hypothetical protein
LAEAGTAKRSRPFRRSDAMSKPGKKLVDAERRYDREQVFAPTEALDLVKAMASHNFDETVEVAFRPARPIR